MAELLPSERRQALIICRDLRGTVEKMIRLFENEGLDHVEFDEFYEYLGKVHVAHQELEPLLSKL